MSTDNNTTQLRRRASRLGHFCRKALLCDTLASLLGSAKHVLETYREEEEEDVNSFRKTIHFLCQV